MIGYIKLIVFLALSSTAAGARKTELEDLPNHIKNLRPSVVEIFVNGRRSGTGFVVGEQGLILTATHVVGDPAIGDQKQPIVKYKEKIEVAFSDGTRIAAMPITNPSELSVFHDMSLLRVHRPHAIALKLSTAVPPDGSLVMLMGFPLDLPQAVTYTGTIASQYPLKAGTYRDNDVFRNMIQVQAPIARGFSGGQLVDFKTNKVIGVIDIKIGGINDRLTEIGLGIRNAGGRGGVTISGIDTNEVLLNLIGVLDQFLSVGSGSAVSIEHISEFVKAQSAEKK